MSKQPNNRTIGPTSGAYVPLADMSISPRFTLLRARGGDVALRTVGSDGVVEDSGVVIDEDTEISFVGTDLATLQANVPASAELVIFSSI